VVRLAYIGPIARYTVVVSGDEETELLVDLHNPGPEQFFSEGTEIYLLLPDEVPALLG
jgi:hypothetical protein